MNRTVHTPTAEVSASDLQLIAEGSEKAFEKLFFQHKNRVYEIALLYTESSFLAEEVLQDIFVQVWHKRAELPAIQNFSSWLFILTRNRSFDVLRNIARASAKNLLAVRDTPEFTEPADTKLLSSEADKLLLQAMGTLTPAQKQCFILAKLKGLSREETARQTGISPNTVKVHLLQAMRTIRAYFIERDLLIPLIAGVVPFFF